MFVEPDTALFGVANVVFVAGEFAFAAGKLVANARFVAVVHVSHAPRVCVVVLSHVAYVPSGLGSYPVVVDSPLVVAAVFPRAGRSNRLFRSLVGRMNRFLPHLGLYYPLHCC